MGNVRGQGRVKNGQVMEDLGLCPKEKSTSEGFGVSGCTCVGGTDMIWLAFAFKGSETLLYRALERTGDGTFCAKQDGEVRRGIWGEGLFLFPYVLSF